MNLLKSFSIYGAFTLLEKGIEFVLLPIFTYYLSTYDYGILANFQVLTSLYTLFILFGSNDALQIEYIKQKSKTFSDYFTSILIHLFILFLIATLVFASSSYYFSRWITIPLLWILLLPIISLGNAISTITQSYLQISEQPFTFGIISISKLIISLSISLILIVGLNFDYSGRLWASLIASITLMLVSLLLYIKKRLLSKNQKLQISTDILVIGFPLFLNSVNYLILHSSDRIFISEMVSIEANGIYHIGYTIGSMIYIYTMIFFRAWTPILYKHLENDTIDSHTYVIKIGLLFFITLVIIIIILTWVISPFIFDYIVESKFHNGQLYVFWVSLSYLFWSFFLFFGHIIFFHKKLNIFIYLGVFSIILNLILNYVFISLFSTIGAAYATCLSLFILSVITIIYSKNFYTISWKTIAKTLTKNH